MAHPRWTRPYLDHDDLEAIKHAIVAAETATSGEIRVHVEPRVPRRRFARPGDPLERARDLFARLGLHRSEERNCVLIYLAVKDRRLAIVGDDGIHARVGDAYWIALRDRMVGDLRGRSLRDGIIAGVTDVGRVLAEHFPPGPTPQVGHDDDVSLG